ncbi:unnamed protein product [Acanthoscelides obtectus]|uniref:Uncharacterized protein n=1 Tax=Acanthoscelides obtectus TaxID=200917 RepID=A0A9P0LUW8_ACAOB|nr:unnamed protein product [Acanthoscelides obtectus]CAK1656470.1 hypothetical protein AOBTE_LOCUS19726 [Acanthoscelides obtectus]
MFLWAETTAIRESEEIASIMLKYLQDILNQWRAFIAATLIGRRWIFLLIMGLLLRELRLERSVIRGARSRRFENFGTVFAMLSQGYRFNSNV